MHKALVAAAAAFIPSREARRRFRRTHADASDGLSFRMFDGTRAYYPIYNAQVPLPSAESELYDATGRRIHTFFLRDFHFSHAPAYTGGRILWDRYNFGLRHHFYTHRAMLETMGHPDRRYGMLGETMGVVPEDYLIFDEHPGLEKDFDRVFTYSKRLLDRLPNAAFVPFCADVKLDFAAGRGAPWPPTEGLHAAKTRDVSILSSGKAMCPLHELRIETARKLRRLGLADAFGTFDSDLGYVRAYDTLAPYRFSVVFENSTEDYAFTEKLTNCLACQTIPIYVGPPSVGDYFNSDGIIRLDPGEVGGIESVLKGATAGFYAERLPAVLDNYRRVQRYRNAVDFMYEEYLAADLDGPGAALEERQS